MEKYIFGHCDFLSFEKKNSTLGFKKWLVTP
jgi:hypothetical protein